MNGQCGSCERPLRAGSVRRAWVLVEGKVASALVCTACLRNAIALVVPPPVAIAPACKLCRRRAASVCEECLHHVGEHVEELTKANVALKQRKP